MKFLILLILSTFFLNASSKSDSLQGKSLLQLDLRPLYYTCFDLRKQVRFGFEYDYKYSETEYLSLYADLGLFEQYTYIKNFNFFDPSNLYFVRNNVEITGFHLIPSYNRNLLYKKNSSIPIVFTGLGLDINYYLKKTSTYNSEKNETNVSKYSQKKLGLGFSVGVKYPLFRRIAFEIKSSIFYNLFRYLPKESIPIKSINAHWNSQNLKFWWTSELKFSYEIGK